MLISYLPIGPGKLPIASRLFSALADYLDCDDDTFQRAQQIVVALAAMVPAFKQESIPERVFIDGSRIYEEAGDLCLAIDAPDMAYNMFEASYNLASSIGAPALPVATKLLDTADAEKLDQFASSAWRFAAERIRESIASGGEWLEALDAIELALAVEPAPDKGFRQMLFQHLMAVVRAARDTPIAAILPMLVTQAPADAVEPSFRRQFYAMLLGATVDQLAAAPEGAVAHLAAIKGQSLADDLRIELSPVAKVRPGLSWTDLSLSHRRLIRVVPLGRSLVADVDRTGGFALELVHEIGHAYCLLGPIGWGYTALRAALHYAEMMLFDVAGRSSSEASWRHADPLNQLPANPLAASLALRQLEIAQRAHILRTVWTPWLEGVALYLELLCDPATSANEIIAPHEIVRGLVDYQVEEPRPGESEDAYSTRYANQTAQEFEKFYTAALKRCSRLRHAAYAQAGGDTSLYLSGYLIVRALVSRWERTLDRQLKPIDAVKLLLDATRNGTREALPDLDLPVEEFHSESLARVTRWLFSLADLDGATLEAFFQEVQPDDRKRPFDWATGKPVPLSEPTDSTLVDFIDDLVTAATSTIMGVPGETREARLRDEGFVRHRAGMGALFEAHYQRMTLVPLGHDSARLLTFDDHSRVAICPRTYAGLDGADSDLRWQRYSIGSWVAPGGADEIHLIRATCARHRTARADVTRVVDMVGYSDSPVSAAGVSYVCCSIGSEWSHVTLGYGRKMLDTDHQTFRQRILSRLEPLPFCRDEANNILSISFLADRLERSGVTAPMTAADHSADAQSAAFALCGRVFGVTEAAARTALLKCASSPVARSEAFAYLHDSGMSRSPEIPRHPHNADLVHLAFDANARSAIKPVTENSWHN